MKGACEAQIVGVCTGRAHHSHHRKLRSQGGVDGWPNTRDVCSPCHTFIHANPAWSYQHGWLVHQWDDPADVAPIPGAAP